MSSLGTLLRGSESPGRILHSAPQVVLSTPSPGAQHTKHVEGSKAHIPSTEGLLLSLQEMGILVPGQSRPSMKERGQPNNLNFPPLPPPLPLPRAMPAELQCESGFVQQEPKNRYKLSDFEVGHGPSD